MPFRHRFVEATPLARGAEGRLYRVRDQWTGRWAALKVAADEAGRTSLRNEFRLLSRLRHPCLLESQDLLDEGAARGHLLEYLPAVEPSTLWDAGGEGAIWAAVIQSLRGLTYVHRQGLVHGDVAPGNILIWREGNQWRAKLADLGLALPFAEAAKAGVRGTPGYWSPETATGQGAFPGSDLYSLGATLFAWIEGRGPWEGLSPSEQLRRLSALPDLPKPRRRVSPELEALLSSLGASQIEARRRWDWTELRARTEAWGPPTLVATVSGLEEPVRAWTEWIHELPGGQVASLVLSGRTGTGRRTAGSALVRELAGRGWMAIWASPLGVLHDRFVETGEDLDPVLAARELSRRSEHRHLVLFWPDRASDLESRILRAFVAAREDASSELRTVVIRTSGIDMADEAADWLRASTRCRVEDWVGPGPEAMRCIENDLFPAEQGASRRAPSRGSESPLALVLSKQGEMQGSGIDVAMGDELEAEIGRLWDRLPARAQVVLTLLAESDQGWTPEDLQGALGWSTEETVAALNDLARWRLARRSFERGTESNEIADLATRSALLRLTQGPDSGNQIAGLQRALETGTCHPGDLGLARRLLARSDVAAGYTVPALDAALREGRYEEVLEFANAASGRHASFGAEAREIWSRFLRAAQRVGRYELEARLLRDLLAWATGEEAILHRKALGQALTHLGDWKQALEECTRIEGVPEATEKDRLWAKLQAAETLWQAGRFTEADEAYATVEGRLSNAMVEEWLRYGVGRARQHGQRGDMAGVKKYLEMTRASVGSEVCEADALYLHTYAGLAIQEEGYLAARDPAQKARQIALGKADWVPFVMASLRSAAISYGAGDMWDASRQGREALTTSAVLKSEVIWSRALAFIAYPEAHLANLGSALRKALAYRELAERNEDKNLLAQASRLLAFLGSLGGWGRFIREGKLLIGGESSTESSSFLKLCEGQYELGMGNHDRAAVLLAETAREMKELGEKDSEVKARILLFLADRERKLDPTDDLDLLGTVDRFPSLGLIAGLVHAEMNPSAAPPGIVAAAGVDLWEKGRFMELIEWFPLLFGRLSGADKQILKGRAINIIQRAASSLDDHDLRREFLEFPRIKRILLLVRAS
jgi:protein kinase-like protein